MEFSVVFLPGGCFNKDEKEVREYRVDQLKFRPRKKKDKNKISAEELKALEELEKKEKREGMSKLDDN